VIAYSAGTWTEIIVAFSIVVPVVVTAVLAWVFLHGAKNDPDAKRLRRVQAEYEARRERPR
jgi:hypothetical protein